MIKPSKFPSQFKLALRESVDGEVLFDKTSRLLFSTDASIFMIEPAGVFIPADSQDICKAVKVCSEYNITLHPRGGASGLAGESLGAGLVLDCHQNFRSISEFDKHNKTVRVGAGVTLTQLNQYLEPHGLKFGPDPSSGNRANFGGMLGTNATGSHSLVYGYTGDHVYKVNLVSASGDLETLQRAKLKKQPAAWQKLIPIIKKWEAVIKTAYPKQHRNRSGYNLEHIYQNEIMNPISLLAGAEGSLGIVTDLWLNLVKLPARTGLVMFLFDDLMKSADGAIEIMQYKPDALELIGEQVISMGRLHDLRLDKILPQNTKAVLLGEWNCDTDGDLSLMHQAIDRMKHGRLTYEVRQATDIKDRDVLWLIRKEAEALIINQPGQKNAISFVEDTAVDYHKLGTWLNIKKQIIEKHGFAWATFGHAGAGELHTKIYADLTSGNEYQRLFEMATELYKAVTKLGGTISGEHGDGLLRSGFIKLQYPELFAAFKEVKDAMDPQGLLNPHKKTGEISRQQILDYTKLADKNLAKSFRTDFLSNVEFNRLATACHGCAACRNDLENSRMCPAFRVSHHEFDSPRARGNLFRLFALGQLSNKELYSNTTNKLVSSCINCKMCLPECPSHIDIASMMLELKSKQFAKNKPSFARQKLADTDKLFKTARLFGTLSTSVINSQFGRLAISKFAGIDKDVSLPNISSGSFYEKAQQISQPETDNSVILYADYYILYQDHQFGLDLIMLINAAGFRVLPFCFGGSMLPAMNIGNLKPLKKAVLKQAQILHKMGKGHDKDYLPIITSEPSACLMLKDEWPKLNGLEIVKTIAKSTKDASDFLLEQLGREETSLKFRPLKKTIAYHQPCHQRLLSKTSSSLKLLSKLKDTTVYDLDAGCCGMAGTYGMFTETRQNSLDMAARLDKKLASSKYDYICSDCSTCRLQLASLTKHSSINHPLQILADSLI